MVLRIRVCVVLVGGGLRWMRTYQSRGVEECDIVVFTMVAIRY